MTVADLAGRLDVHPNTVRFHLRSLEAEGQVVRSQATRAGAPGRPEQTFRIPPNLESAPQRADLLAHVLLHHLGAEENAQVRAKSAGRSWGQAEAHRFGRCDADPLEGLVDTLEEAGFAPSHSASSSLDLHHCPLQEFLGDGQRLVCAVHEGMMAGFLDEAKSTMSVEYLEPFATPGLCRTHLIRR